MLDGLLETGRRAKVTRRFLGLSSFASYDSFAMLVYSAVTLHCPFSELVEDYLDYWFAFPHSDGTLSVVMEVQRELPTESGIYHSKTSDDAFSCQ